MPWTKTYEASRDWLRRALERCEQELVTSALQEAFF